MLRQQLLQQQAQDAAPSVTVIGPVQNSTVPWVAGLTPSRAPSLLPPIISDANPPEKIILTRQGDSATLDAHVLLNGPDVPLENRRRHRTPPMKWIKILSNLTAGRFCHTSRRRNGN